MVTESPLSVTECVEVTGVLQPDETPSKFMPINQIAGGKFHSLDRVGMVRERHGTGTFAVQSGNAESRGGGC